MPTLLPISTPPSTAGTAARLGHFYNSGAPLPAGPDGPGAGLFGLVGPDRLVGFRPKLPVEEPPIFDPGSLIVPVERCRARCLVSSHACFASARTNQRGAQRPCPHQSPQSPQGQGPCRPGFANFTRDFLFASTIATRLLHLTASLGKGG